MPTLPRAPPTCRPQSVGPAIDLGWCRLHLQCHALLPQPVGIIIFIVIELHGCFAQVLNQLQRQAAFLELSQRPVVFPWFGGRWGW
jgi:hypothetical protein